MVSLQMKRCLTCGTISKDSDLNCGVCGASIADTPSESLEEARHEHNADVLRKSEEERKARGKIDKRRAERIISESVLGFAGMFGGIILVGQYKNIYGLLAVLLGMLLLIHALFGSLGPFRIGFGRGGRIYR